ncbi:MAG: multicopper oxidase domain-containing protein [Chthoniobacterales bacterium]
MPSPITRKESAVVKVSLNAGYETAEIAPKLRFVFWTFNGHTPSPFIRARQGDTLQVEFSSTDDRGMSHNVDFHAVMGTGGGALLLNASKGMVKSASFKLLHPGLFVYHCAQPPTSDHIANGMYGLILVEPEAGLPKVDHEFYVMQSEFYTSIPPVGGDATLDYSRNDGLAEHPTFVVFNGRVGALTGHNALHVKTGERVRIYFGDIGPNLVSSFHVIGSIFDTLYREGDLVDPPVHDVSVTLVPAGGTAVVEMTFEVPGEYTLVDHSMFRTDKGATGTIIAEGPPRPDIYRGAKQDAIK